MRVWDVLDVAFDFGFDPRVQPQILLGTGTNGGVFQIAVCFAKLFKFCSCRQRGGGIRPGDGSGRWLEDPRRGRGGHKN